jgi:hypothetical protein
MFKLKPLSPEAIPAAIEKAERYRLLNEPGGAESICLDVLDVDPDNQRALTILLLALTDQFNRDKGLTDGVARARKTCNRLAGDYERAYYSGLISERRARARLNRGGSGAGYAAYDWLREAMDWYEKAEAIRPLGNDDAILRWNACARMLMRHPDLKPAPHEPAEAMLE